MLVYIARRIVYVIPIVISVALVCFLLVHITPGDPLVAVLPADASQELAQQLRDDQSLRLDGGHRRSIGHWRIRVPSGSTRGCGWIRAGRRRPMISISSPLAPGPSGVASSAGT